MSWHRLDVGYFRNRKVGRLSHRQMCLDIAAIGQCHSDLTDGLLSPAALGHVLIDSRAKRSDVRVLVEQGRWEAVEGGWRLHDYSKHNQSAETITKQREAHARDMAELREARRRPQEGMA